MLRTPGLTWLIFAGCSGAPPIGSISSALLCTPGTTEPCSTFNSLYTGTAVCKTSGWDLSTCSTNPTFTNVVPATRDSTQWGDAVCNDGSPFNFFIRPVPSSHKWVIYFQGGIFCDDNSYRCDVRYNTKKALTETSTGPSHMPLADGAHVDLEWSDDESGVLGTHSVNPDLFDGNLVYAHYCSSDFWSGSRTTAITTTANTVNGNQDWYFSGQLNAKAMIEALQQDYNLDDSYTDLSVLVTGGSSGGFGAHLNTWQLENALPTAKMNKRLRLLVDAGWWIEWNTEIATHYLGQAVGQNDLQVAETMLSFWQAQFDPTCVTHNSSEPAHCLFGPTWYPELIARVPVMVAQSRIDAMFGVVDHKLSGPSTARTAWANQVKTSLDAVNWVFSGLESYHTLVDVDAGVQVGPPGSRLLSVIDAFWESATPQTTVDQVFFQPVKPAVTINRMPPLTDPVSTFPPLVIEFSEPIDVAQVTPSIVSFAGSTFPSTLWCEISVYPQTPMTPPTSTRYLVTVHGDNLVNQTVVVSVPGGGVTDSDGNSNTPSTSYSNVIHYASY